MQPRQGNGSKSLFARILEKSRLGMSFSAVSVLCCVASLTLLFQFGLYNQLLQRKTGSLLNGDLTNIPIHQYSTTDLKARTIKISPRFDEFRRNKRFLTESNDLVSSGTDTSSVTATQQTASLATIGASIAHNIFSRYTDSVTGSTVIDNSTATKNPWLGVPADRIISNFYTGNFILPNVKLCSRGKENLTLIVLIPSAIPHFHRRQSVRNTWGSFALRRDVAIGFVFGNPKLSEFNGTALDNFQKEIDLYGDMIIADMLDTYKNLTLKTLYMVEWASTYCSSAKFYLKTDDDMFLNVPVLLDFISKIEESDAKQPKIYGNVFSGHMPNRNVSHKHHVNTEIYPYEIKYPNFTSGPAYLVSSRVLRPLLKHAVHLPLFNLEDVFLTGFVASDLNIPRVNVTKFRNELENPFKMSACKINKIIAGMTDGSDPEIYYVWYNYLLGRVICKYIPRRKR